jgi:hypothetical protein
MTKGARFYGVVIFEVILIRDKLLWVRGLNKEKLLAGPIRMCKLSSELSFYVCNFVCRLSEFIIRLSWKHI